MKKLVVLVVSFFAFVSCNCQKKVVENESKPASEMKELKSAKVEYVANSRGFYQGIIFENELVMIANQRDTKPENVKTNEQDIKELKSYLSSVKLDQLSTYKDPTQKRFYDGAAIAHLKITVDGVEYRTVDFDHGFPPIEIEKLVNKMISFNVKK